MFTERCDLDSWKERRNSSVRMKPTHQTERTDRELVSDAEQQQRRSKTREVQPRDLVPPQNQDEFGEHIFGDENENDYVTPRVSTNNRRSGASTPTSQPYVSAPNSPILSPKHTSSVPEIHQAEESDDSLKTTILRGLESDSKRYEPIDQFSKIDGVKLDANISMKGISPNLFTKELYISVRLGRRFELPIGKLLSEDGFGKIYRTISHTFSCEIGGISFASSQSNLPLQPQQVNDAKTSKKKGVCYDLLNLNVIFRLNILNF